MPKGPPRRSLEVRFWSKVLMGPGCWEWQGAKRHGGYGVITTGGTSGKLLAAHRVMWERCYGPIPDGMILLHKCDNPPCVRPEHLTLGTQQDNIEDGMRKGRINPRHTTNRRRGAANHATKLSDAEKAEIRARYLEGGISQMTLAQQYGVHQTVVSRVVRLGS